MTVYEGQLVTVESYTDGVWVYRHKPGKKMEILMPDGTWKRISGSQLHSPTAPGLSEPYLLSPDYDASCRPV